MGELFKAKLRKIGTSTGVLIPQERLIEIDANIGDEIELAILPHKKDTSGFGIAKKFTIAFTRDKKVRSFK